MSSHDLTQRLSEGATILAEDKARLAHELSRANMEIAQLRDIAEQFDAYRAETDANVHEVGAALIDHGEDRRQGESGWEQAARLIREHKAMREDIDRLTRERDEWRETAAKQAALHDEDMTAAKGAIEHLKAQRDLAIASERTLTAYLQDVMGALMDAGDVAVPEIGPGLARAVGEVVRQRDAGRAEAERLAHYRTFVWGLDLHRKRSDEEEEDWQAWDECAIELCRRGLESTSEVAWDPSAPWAKAAVRFPREASLIVVREHPDHGEVRCVVYKPEDTP